MFKVRARPNNRDTVTKLLTPERDRGRDLRPGSYVTDGRRLFRVISQFTPDSARVFATLEDCRTLEVRPYSPDELYSMRLRPLSPPIGRGED